MHESTHLVGQQDYWHWSTIFQHHLLIYIRQPLKKMLAKYLCVSTNMSN